MVQMVQVQPADSTTVHSSTAYKPYLTYTQLYTLAFVIRVLLSIFGDSFTTNVKYTDIDYTVFTDAAQYMLDGDTPYKRATYRYTPLIAMLCIPNLTLFTSFAKLAFCVSDIVTAYLTQLIVSRSTDNARYIRYAVLLSLFNPLNCTISSRGSADTLIALLCVLTMYTLQQRWYRTAGVAFGLAVHLKIYPIIYLPSIILYISQDQQIVYVTRSNLNYISTQAKQALVDNTRIKLRFALWALLTMAGLTYAFYSIYGYMFLHETYLYHTSRIDHRHNFSVWFYTQYLNYVRHPTDSLPQLYGMLTMPAKVFSAYVNAIQLFGICTVSLYCYRDLAVCWFLVTNVFVHSNKVITAQYFIWYVTYAPMFLHTVMQSRYKLHVCVTVAAWFATELLWLYHGYQLEFLGNNVYDRLHAASLLFYAANIALCCTILRVYQAAQIYTVT